MGCTVVTCGLYIASAAHQLGISPSFMHESRINTFLFFPRNISSAAYMYVSLPTLDALDATHMKWHPD
jgi:hypothetical protein